MNLLFSNDRVGDYPESWYAATADPLAPFAPLRGDKVADVCVIGGGYTGLSAALHLAAAGLDVTLLEAHRVGFGASGRNGGQLGSGQRQGQKWLEKRLGMADARRLWDLAEDAKKTVHDICRKHGVEAGFRPGVAQANWHKSDMDYTVSSAEHLREVYNYDKIEVLDKPGFDTLVGTDVFAGGSVDWGAGHLHPLRYALGLAKAAQQSGAQIHEGSYVTKIRPGKTVTVETGTGRVEASQVILACNGYLGALDRKLAARVMPINNFIVATQPLGGDYSALLARDIAVADSRFVVNYWRMSEDGRLLFGGGESYGYRFPRDIAALVRRPMAEIYPALAKTRIDYAWGGTLAITMNRMPCFARPAPNILSASGYSGHGLAMATLAGRILAQASKGLMGDFDVMSRLPSPAFPGGALMRSPLLALAMTWYGLRDRMGF